jgi:hypothetical protein
MHLNTKETYPSFLQAKASKEFGEIQLWDHMTIFSNGHFPISSFEHLSSSNFHS